MKRILYLTAVVCLFLTGTAHAQNADQLYFNQLASGYDYQAASFVVDTAPLSSNFKRAFLLWSKRYSPDTLGRFQSLDEFDPNGDFISEHVNPQPYSPTEYIIPKKIIKAQTFNGYYLLGYVIKSFNLISTYQVYSSPIIIKIDDKLNPIWVRKIHYSTVTPNNLAALIEYNDIVEARNGEIIIAGRYSTSFSGQQTRVLVSRLKSSGTLIWTYHYFNAPVCNAAALSVTEASDESIVLTGYIEDCVNPSFSGNKHALYMALKGSGLPILAERLASKIASVGDKIVKHPGSNGESFFISGYIDVPTITGSYNRQILLIDIKEYGGLISAYHIGDAGAEVANDLVFQYFGNDDFYLYLTGSTTSYDPTVKSDVYYLQLKYSGFNLGVAEFSTFPRPTKDYVARIGLEIKKAGKERFAILENAVYTVGQLQPQSRTFTNVLVRDLQETSGKCIKQFDPPVERADIYEKEFRSDVINPGFTVYKDNYKNYEKVYPKLECGEFFIDPYSAATVAGNPDQVERKAAPVAATTIAPAGIRVYPNPVGDLLNIEYGKATNENVSISIYSNNLQLIKQVTVPAKSRITVPVSKLASGFYIVQLKSGSGVQSFKVMKE